MDTSIRPRTSSLVAALLFSVGALGCQSFKTTDEGLRAYQANEFKLAVDEWEPLAKDGDADAQFFIAVMYEEGRGVAPDPIEAQEWYQRAAAQGHAHAQLNLGLMYFHGSGVQQSHAKAHSWFLTAAENGLPEARGNLGVLYLKGEGVEQNLHQAKAHFELAAEGGDGRSQRILAEMHAEGLGTDADPAQAGEWMQSAAESGDIEAQVHHGAALLRDGRADEAYPILSAAALAGQWEAQFLLGWMHQTGQGAPRDQSLARAWLQSAAESGSALARTGAAMSLIQSADEPTDAAATDAAGWLQLAADSGFAAAQYDLGLAYLQGRGVARDQRMGREWLRRSARQGFPDAREKLAIIGEYPRTR